MDSAAEEEIALTGGNMDPVVRVGDTVRRVAGPWTPAVHGVLRAAADAGIREAPEVHGIDERGRESLTFLPGALLAEAPDRWSGDILDQAGSLLRRIHDATADIAHTGPWRTPAHLPVEVVRHNDFAPYNLLVTDGRISGVIDWDMASPGPRIWDLAYLAYRLVPLAEDAGAPTVDRGARMIRLLAAYGMPYTADDVTRVAVDRLVELAEFTDARAAETGRTDLREHARMYRRDAERLRADDGSHSLR